MGLLPIGGFQLNEGLIRLASSKKIQKTLFSNPQTTEIVTNYASGKDAKQALDQFGEFAKGISLDPKHAYKYCNVHGAAQLFDMTANKSVIDVVKRLKRPLTTFFRENVFKKILK